MSDPASQSIFAEIKKYFLMELVNSMGGKEGSVTTDYPKELRGFEICLEDLEAITYQDYLERR